MLDYDFLHYRGGGNWDHKSAEFHQQKTAQLNKFIDQILKSEPNVAKE